VYVQTVVSPTKMGPKRIFPNTDDKAGREWMPEEGVVEIGGEWSGGEDEDDGGGGRGGGCGGRAMGLHLPHSVSMDPAHVELVKRTMASISMPSLGNPAWAKEITDEQWKDMVQQTIQTCQVSASLRVEQK
uniref:Male-enhanced antigen 1 n=1 Tax=Erpetoichthys calabaricus TaxID=27687 RepID=A0A8C4S334_ERPCA